MGLDSKAVLVERLGQSAKDMNKVRIRKETERATEAQQEAEPRPVSPVDLTRR